MIKGSRFVSQVVLVGNERRFPAALIVPNFEQLESYARLKNLDLKTPKDFCESRALKIFSSGRLPKLTKDLAQYEKVKKIALLENELTVEGGELTPTLKVKRRVVDEKYNDIIEKIYAMPKRVKDRERISSVHDFSFENNSCRLIQNSRADLRLKPSLMPFYRIR